jgi:predicted lipoprotein
MKLKPTIVLFTGLILLSFACKKKVNQNTEEPAASFDKQAMLVQLADELIIPSYESFKTSLDSLILVYAEFKLNPSLSGLQSVKTKYQKVYVRYQRCGLFEFGPAEAAIVRSSFNVFPTDTLQIKANISSGVYDLNLVANIDAKGLPALDYLFYSLSSDESVVVNAFSASAERRNYVSNLLNDMSGRISAVLSAWKGTYRNTFINSLGTDVGSSIGYLINQMNFELDYLKNAKIGIPLGKKTLGIVQPTQCEVYYSGGSQGYAIETLKAIENLYMGRSLTGNNGKGFDDYLDHLKVMYGSETLNSAINKQFVLAFSKLNAIQGSISQQVVTNPGAVDAAYVELVKLLVLLKTDLPSSLGVVITYQDGDGD